MSADERFWRDGAASKMPPKPDSDVTWLLKLLRGTAFIAVIIFLVGCGNDLWHHDWRGLVLDAAASLGFLLLWADAYNRVKARTDV